MKVNKDYYDVLGVSPQDSQERIKQVFRKKAQLYHPDQNPGDKYAEEMFKEISDAYDVLGDKDKREAYDRERRLNHQTHSTAGSGASTASSQPKAQSTSQSKSSGSSSAGSTPNYKPRAHHTTYQDYVNSQSTSQSSDQSEDGYLVKFLPIVPFLFVPGGIIYVTAGDANGAETAFSILMLICFIASGIWLARRFWLN